MAIIIGGIIIPVDGVSNFVAYSHIIGTSAKDSLAVSTMSHLPGLYSDPVSAVLVEMLTTGAILSLTTGLYYGGAAYMQHFVLRFLLWCRRSVPFNYPRFLDYATERILLRKVGGGYIFIHRLLQEYFASVSDNSTKDAGAKAKNRGNASFLTGMKRTRLRSRSYL